MNIKEALSLAKEIGVKVKVVDCPIYVYYDKELKGFRTALELRSGSSINRYFSIDAKNMEFYIFGNWELYLSEVDKMNLDGMKYRIHRKCKNGCLNCANETPELVKLCNDTYNTISINVEKLSAEDIIRIYNHIKENK